MMKYAKILWLLVALCACLLVVAVPAVAGASDAAGRESITDASGQWEYVLENGGATIVYYWGDANGDLIIPEMLDGIAVKRIRSVAETDLSGPTGPYNVTSITIPDGIISMEENPFAGCRDLMYINVSADNPTYAQIDGVLFEKKRKTLIAYPCAREGEYTVPEGVLSIGDEAFAITGLTSVTLSDGITGIGDRAFVYSECLTSVTLPDSVTSIGDWAFAHCNGLTCITIPGSVARIGDNAFMECRGLTSVTFLDGIASIGDYAFSNCIGLTSITIPNSVTSIGDCAFRRCEGLTSATIPASVQCIGINPFYGCLSLAINVSGYNERYECINNVLMDKQQKLLISCPTASGAEYKVPEGILYIGNHAFADCGGLTGIIIPRDVAGIGDYAFINCNGLTGMTIPDGVTSVGNGAFYDCAGLTSVIIPASVANIGEEAFKYCYRLTLAVISGSAAEHYAKSNGIPCVYPGDNS